LGTPPQTSLGDPEAPSVATTARRTLYRDYETRSTLDLRKCGAWVYATHPTTEVLCCAYAADDGPVKLWIPGEPIPPEFREVARNSDWVVSAFNDNFERQIERHIMSPRYGWPTIRLSGIAALRRRHLPLLCRPLWAWPHWLWVLIIRRATSA
jgi:hypothetical protein